MPRSTRAHKTLTTVASSCLTICALVLGCSSTEPSPKDAAGQVTNPTAELQAEDELAVSGREIARTEHGRAMNRDIPAAQPSEPDSDSVDSAASRPERVIVEESKSADLEPASPRVAEKPAQRPPRKAKASSHRRSRAKRDLSGASMMHRAGGMGSAQGFSPPPMDAAMPGGDAYAHVVENEFITVAQDPRSTFSIDVDTASYANTRRFINEGRLPPPDAVRSEELINYFSYDYPKPKGNSPFSVTSEVGVCPWNPANKLVHIGIQGQSIEQGSMPPRNLVFLLDVSGSMASADRLPLLVDALVMLSGQLDQSDRVSIVVYAGASGLVLPPTQGSDRETIRAALKQLRAGGSTNGGSGIELAYRVARENFVRDGINRVILATDGDFNVGATSEGALVRMIERERKSGVFLSVLRFGRGNLNDSTMEKLADRGNGNYAYIDSRREARKVLVQQAGATLVTIAKDVKLQLEFNPTQVESYRLIGYENRKLAHRDFADDTKDAGEIGAGHSVTAIYEIVPRDQQAQPESGKATTLRYQGRRPMSDPAHSDELLVVKIRHKHPKGAKSREYAVPVLDGSLAGQQASEDFRFSAAVAEFAQLLRNSKHASGASYAQVIAHARSALGKDLHGHRAEFVALATRAAQLAGRNANARR